MSSITKSQISEARRRAKDYRNIDGLPMLLGGLAHLLALSIGLFINYVNELAGFLLLAFTMVVWWFIGSHEEDIIEWLKERITYPRTGYVEEPSSNYPKAEFIKANEPELRPQKKASDRNATVDALVLLIFCVLLGLFVAFWVATGFAGLRWVGPGFLVVVGILSSINKKERKFAWFYFAGFLLSASAVVTLPFGQKHPIFSVWFSIALLVTLRGFFIFLRYLYRNPLPQS